MWKWGSWWNASEDSRNRSFNAVHLHPKLENKRDTRPKIRSQKTESCQEEKEKKIFVAQRFFRSPGRDTRPSMWANIAK